MAQQMSLKEMIRVIDDVLGGSFVVTLWTPRDGHHCLEVKSQDEGGSEVGQFDVDISTREAYQASLRMKKNIEYTLDTVPFNVIQILSFKDEDFRDYIYRELVR